MDNEQIKKAMIDLIKKSSEFEENFIFEKLQDYMDFSNGKATWKSNVRLRMLENKEIREQIENENEKAIKEILLWIDEVTYEDESGRHWKFNEAVPHEGYFKDLERRINIMSDEE